MEKGQGGATSNESFLRGQMRGEIDVTPEDTVPELVGDVETVALRHSALDVPGVAPDDTRAELLDKQAAASVKREPWRFDNGFVDPVLYYADGQRQYDAAMAEGDTERAYDVADSFNLAHQHELSGFTLESFAKDYELAHQLNQQYDLERLGATASAGSETVINEETQIMDKEDRKIEEAELMRTSRLDAARNMTDEQAKARALQDIEEHAGSLDAGQDAFYLRNDMAERASVNAAYAAALEEAAPDLARQVADNEQGNVKVDVQTNLNLAAAEAASQDVAAFMDTKPDDLEGRAAVVARMQERGDDIRYTVALSRLTPNLAELSQPHTRDVQQALYENEVRRREEQQRDNPETKDEQQRVVASRERDEQDRAAKAQANQLDDELRRRKARETELAGQGLNSVDVQRSGKELESGEFMMPRQITQAYTEVDGKFYTKDKERPMVMFEDKGDKLATSTTDKKAIEDMVALAKAKQWDSLKLTGSQEFRREAWLQAESQGIKTQGYTPKEKDLAALETLRQERATNSIQPRQERKQQERGNQAQAEKAAPRHDLNKNQASMHFEATKAIATNLQELQKKPGMADRSLEDLNKLAYWRGIVAEENKMQAKPVQDEALARFDKQAADPQFLSRLDQETKASVNERTTERAQRRETHEQSL